jgi:hypothetical protein
VAVPAVQSSVLGARCVVRATAQSLVLRSRWAVRAVVQRGGRSYAKPQHMESPLQSLGEG